MNENENPNLNEQPAVQPTAPEATATAEAASVTPAPAPAPADAPEQAPAWTAPAPQPVYAEPAPKKKKGGKAVLIILLLLLLAGIAVGGFFLIKSLLNAPANSDRILQAYENTAKAMLPSGMQNLGKEVAVDLSADLSKLPMDLPISGAVNGRADLKNKKFGLSLKANVMAISLNALSLYASPDDFSLQSPLLIGNDAYGLSLKDAEANLSNSVLNPDSGSSFALPKETYETIAKILPMLRKLTSVEPEKIWNSLKNEIWKEVDALNVTERGQEKITVLEKECDTDLIAVKMTGVQLCEMIEKVLDWAEKAPEFAELFQILDTLTNQNGEGERTYLAEFRETIKNAKEKGDKVTITVNGYIEKATGYLVRLDAGFKNENGEGETGSFRNDVRIEKDFVKNSMEVSRNGEAPQKFYTNWDKTTGEYAVFADGTDPILTAEVKAENDSLTVTPKKINFKAVPVPGDLPSSIPSEMDLSFVTMTIYAKAEEPALPSYKELLTMSEEELSAVIQSIMDKIRSLGGPLF